MVRDRLRLLQGVHRRGVERARQALGACVGAEAAVMDRIAAIDDAASRDRTAAMAGEEGCRFVEMFVLRQGTEQAARSAAEVDLVSARVRSAEARAVLVSARTAAEAVAKLIAERVAAEQAAADRREQHVLDDLARSRFAGGSG